jgi:hypothetical protein
VESHHRCPGHCRGQSLLITDEYQSPFNVGTVIEMRDFSLSEVSDLNERYGEPLQSTEDLSRFYELFCGQPFLTRLGFAELLRTGSLDRLIAEADIDEGPFGDHLRHLLALLTRATDLAAVLQGLLCGLPVADPSSFYRLRRVGLIVGSSWREARVRCGIYRSYMSRHLPGPPTPGVPSVTASQS